MTRLAGYLLYQNCQIEPGIPCMGDSGEKRPRRFFRWFWDFLKTEIFSSFQFFLLKSFILNCFSKCNQHFQPVLICWVLIAEKITKMSHTQQWFYWNSTFQSWILLKHHWLHNKTKVFLIRTILRHGPGSKMLYPQQ